MPEDLLETEDEDFALLSPEDEDDAEHRALLEEIDTALVQEHPDQLDRLVGGRTVEERTVVLELHRYRPCMYKKIDPNSVIKGGVIRGADGEEEIIDLKLLSVSKRLIDKKDLREINKKSSQFIRNVKLKCVKSSMLHSSMHLLPIAEMEAIDRLVTQFEAELVEALDKLELVYDDIKERQRTRLGPEFDPADYPPFGEWRAAWTVEANFWSFNVSAALSSINREMFIDQVKKFRLKWADTGEEVRQALREEVSEAINYFADITEETDGKRKAFKTAKVENLKAFFENIEARDLTNDEETVNLARQVRQLLSGVDIKKLRTEEDMRGEFREAFNSIKERASKLVIDRGERRFAFPDAEDLPSPG